MSNKCATVEFTLFLFRLTQNVYAYRDHQIWVGGRT